MAQQNDIFIGSNYGWSDGEDNWGEGLNETLLMNAFLHNRRINGVIGIGFGLPMSPAEGDAYFLSADNLTYFYADGSWHSIETPIGSEFIIKGSEDRVRFNGTEIVQAVSDSTSGSGFTLKSFNDTSGANRYYSLNVGRSGGTEYAPYVSVSSVSENGLTTYFEEELALASNIDRIRQWDVSDQNFDLQSSYNAGNIRATFGGDKTVTIQPESSIPQLSNSYFYITNRNAGDLTIALGSGVTLNKSPLKEAIIQRYGSVRIDRVATDTYDLTFIEGDDFGIGGNAIPLSPGDINDHADRASGLYSAPAGYEIFPSVDINTTSPLFHYHLSSGFAAQMLFSLPSDPFTNDDGEIWYRDKNGFSWSDYRRIITSREKLDLSDSSSVYFNSTIVSGVAVVLQVWANTISREAFLVVEVAGTASSAITGATLPDLAFSFTPAGIGGNYISVPLFTGGRDALQTNSGCLNIDSSGEVRFSIANGAAFTPSYSAHMYYRCS